MAARRPHDDRDPNGDGVRELEKKADELSAELDQLDAEVKAREDDGDG